MARDSTADEDEPLPCRLEPEPAGVELRWLVEEFGVLGVLIEDALLWLLKLELLDDEPLEKLGAELLCVVLEEDEALDELADELLLLVVEECWARSTVGTSVRLTTIRINRRIPYLLLSKPDERRYGLSAPTAGGSILAKPVKKTYFQQRSVSPLKTTTEGFVAACRDTSGLICCCAWSCADFF